MTPHPPASYRFVGYKDDALQRPPHKSELHWREQAMVPAYASALTALSLRAPRHAVLRLTVQISAEWDDGKFEICDINALHELNKAEDYEEGYMVQAPGTTPLGWDFDTNKPGVPLPKTNLYDKVLADAQAYLNCTIKDDLTSCEVLSARAFTHGRVREYDKARDDLPAPSSMPKVQVWVSITTVSAGFTN